MSKGKEMRLRAWKDFRDSIVDLDDTQKIESINRYWMLYPFLTRSIDPDDATAWLGPWDMVYEDQICEYSRAIMMHQTALITVKDIQESYLIYALDGEHQRDCMLAVVNGLVMNYGMDIVELASISSKLNVQNKFKSNKKGLYSII